LIINKMKNTLVYVDTDIGLGTPGAEIDDAAALIMLMTSPGLTLLGAGSIFGNVPCGDALVNLCRLQSFFNRSDILSGRGTNKPLIENMEWFSGWLSSYGETLPFEVSKNLPTSTHLMIDLVKEHPHQVTILAIGPLTNLALAVQLEPDFIPLVKEVVAMGGSFGSKQEIPEFNMHCDPEAADIVFNAGWNLKLVGINITGQVKYTRKEFASLKGSHSATLLLQKMAPGWIDRMEEMGWEHGGCALHDAIPVAYLLNQSLLTFNNTGVKVELHDIPKRGVIHFDDADPSLPQALVATDVDVMGCHDMVWSYIQNCEG
jgi:purine nucleosidase